VEAALAKLDEQVASAKVRPDGRNPFGLWVKVPLLPSSAVVRVGRVLSPLFHPVVVVGLGVVLGYLGYLLVTGSVFAGAGSAMERGGSVWPALALVLVSGFVHELGHTTASIRYGAPGGQIGFGLYIVYPVFYSDVSAAWTLPRRERVVVDVGGVYFQLLVVVCYLLLFRFTGWEAARLAAVGALGLVTFALIPIFKFDGYWLLSDALGLPNLSAQVGRAFRQARDSVLRRRVDRLPWPGWVTCVVVVYGAFSILFLGYLLFRIVPAAVDVAVSYPARIGGLFRDLSTPPYRPATGRLHTIIFPGFLLIGVSFGLFTIGRRLVPSLFHIVRRKHDKAPAGPAPASGADDADRLPGTAGDVAERENRQLYG
jgi:putative peptide zinc metalloprotease protein